MEQAAVDNVVKTLGPVPERQGVLREERRRDAALLGFPPGALERHFEKVDADHLAAACSEDKGRVACSTTGVENGAGNPVRRVDERLLRLTDVPGRFPG